MFGRDRPGIVAAVTRVLADAGCNLVYATRIELEVPTGRAGRVGADLRAADLVDTMRAYDHGVGLAAPRSGSACEPSAWT